MIRTTVAAVATLLVLVAPAAVLADGRHVVSPGETLSSIAAHYGVSQAELQAANAIGDSDLIYVGEELLIPDATLSTQGLEQPAAYVVQLGDTLSGVAQRFGVSIPALAEVNSLDNLDLIVAGELLLIPPYNPGVLPPPEEVGFILESQASEVGLDAGLVKALAYQESGWQQWVVSSAGAVGVMQLLPDTASWVSDYLVGQQLDYVGSAHDNVRGGVAFLSHLLNLSGWDVTTALASYYQGWYSVQEEGIHPGTQNYIDNVLALWERFE